MQEKEARQQVAVLNQRLLDKEQQVAQLTDTVDTTRIDGQQQIRDIRLVT